MYRIPERVWSSNSVTRRSRCDPSRLVAGRDETRRHRIWHVFFDIKISPSIKIHSEPPVTSPATPPPLFPRGEIRPSECPPRLRMFPTSWRPSRTPLRCRFSRRCRAEALARRTRGTSRLPKRRNTSNVVTLSRNLARGVSSSAPAARSPRARFRGARNDRDESRVRRRRSGSRRSDEKYCARTTYGPRENTTVRVPLRHWCHSPVPRSAVSGSRRGRRGTRRERRQIPTLPTSRRSYVHRSRETSGKDENEKIK